MSTLSLNLPTLGADNATEDPKVRQALADIQTAFNGDIDATNLSAALQALLGVGSTQRGKSIIATEQSRTDTAYGKLTTPDEVTGIVLPTDGLLFIDYKALWKSTGSAATALAAIFLNSDQLKYPQANGAPGTTATTYPGGAGFYGHLSSGPDGLRADPANLTANASDVATGQVLMSRATDDGGSTVRGSSICVVFAAAGTYTVSVQFKATAANTVTVKDRKLWVWTMGF